MSIRPISVMWRLCGRNCRARPSRVYFPIRGPRLKSTPRVKAPDMIEAVVHENSRNARKKTRLMLLVRFGPNASDQGIPPWQATEVKSLEFGPIGRPGWLQL